MSAISDLYIRTQVVSALYEVNLIGNPEDEALAARLIEALYDRSIELRPM